MLYLSLLSSVSLFIRAAVKGTHLAAIHLAACMCVCARVSIDVSLFKEVLGWVSGVDCSRRQYCSCGFGCHGNNYACTVQSGQSQYYSTALECPAERARPVVSSYLLNINVCVETKRETLSFPAQRCPWARYQTAKKSTSAAQWPDKGLSAHMDNLGTTNKTKDL